MTEKDPIESFLFESHSMFPPRLGNNETATVPAARCSGNLQILSTILHVTIFLADIEHEVHAND